MPTATDEKLGEQIHEVAENLAGFRLEMAERLGAGQVCRGVPQ